MAVVRDMIIARITGGLGNQMFQYAACRTLADRLGTDLFLDLSFYDLPPGEHTQRPFELDRVRTRYQRAAADQLRPFIALRDHTWTRRTARLFPFLYRSQRYLERQLFRYEPELGSIKQDTYIDGHWQSELYFADHAETIRRDLCPREAFGERNKTMLRSMEGIVPVSLHVRRGDYVTNADANRVHGTSDVTYFERAMKRVLELAPYAVFHVFSDDPEWARKNLPALASLIFVEHNMGVADHFDLLLMSACHHHIIANSSFSWWGAWLNPRPNKLVIAPERWFRDPSVDTTDLIPANWVRL